MAPEIIGLVIGIVVAGIAIAIGELFARRRFIYTGVVMTNQELLDKLKELTREARWVHDLAGEPLWRDREEYSLHAARLANLLRENEQMFPELDDGLPTLR